ncbi:MAG: flavin reductase family protein [Candidatus Kapaibacterium sp.]
MKKSLGARTYLYPNPALLVGSYDENEVPNIMTVAWGGIACSDPPALSVSIRKSRYTFDNITRRRAFTVNIPSVEYVGETHYCGVISGRDENKFETLGLTAVRSELADAPYVRECPVNLICGLLDVVEVGSHVMFIGEILDVLSEECFLTDKGQLSIGKIRPILYDYPGASYHAIGDLALEARKFDVNKYKK